MQWRRQLAGGFRLRLLLRSRNWLRIVETAFVPRAPRSSEHELDACLERERCTAGRDLCNRAEAVHADPWHGGGGERRAGESEWARYGASEASAGRWSIGRATVQRDRGRIWGVRVRVHITVVGEVEEITGQYHVQSVMYAEGLL